MLIDAILMDTAVRGRGAVGCWGVGEWGGWASARFKFKHAITAPASVSGPDPAVQSGAPGERFRNTQEFGLEEDPALQDSRAHPRHVLQHLIPHDLPQRRQVLPP